MYDDDKFAPIERAAAVMTFLEHSLASGAVAVAELEARARSAGILRSQQRITDANAFKRAKKKLGVRSIRDGFGPRGSWSWALPTESNTDLAETAAELAPKAPASVIYADDHSRPEQHHAPDQRVTTGMVSAPIGTTPIRRVPLQWLTGVARLGELRRPASIPQHRWQLFLGDCARFLDQREGWAERAADLDWDTESLFGCDPHRPLDRTAAAGLLWRVSGGRITALHRDWAVITAPDGSQRTYHRRPISMRSALPWQLR